MFMGGLMMAAPGLNAQNEESQRMWTESGSRERRIGWTIKAKRRLNEHDEGSSIGDALN
jgi:hypothetical protein